MTAAIGVRAIGKAHPAGWMGLSFARNNPLGCSAMPKWREPAAEPAQLTPFRRLCYLYMRERFSNFTTHLYPAQPTQAGSEEE